MSNDQAKGHDSRAIANIFVRKAKEAGHRLTIMSLVKYVYFAHGWTLGYTKEPLICHDVQAWRYGPVIPEVYYAFRGKGFIVRGPAKMSLTKLYEAEPTDRQNGIIDGVYTEYSKMRPWELSATTHHSKSPWSKYDGKHYSVISNKEIMDYYQDIIRRKQNDK